MSTWRQKAIDIAPELKIALKVDVHIGDNWGEL